jgi:hypothetical protein
MTAATAQSPLLQTPLRKPKCTCMLRGPAPEPQFCEQPGWPPQDEEGPLACWQMQQRGTDSRLHAPSPAGVGPRPVRAAGALYPPQTVCQLRQLCSLLPRLLQALPRSDNLRVSICRCQKVAHQHRSFGSASLLQSLDVKYKVVVCRSQVSACTVSCQLAEEPATDVPRQVCARKHLAAH